MNIPLTSPITTAIGLFICFFGWRLIDLSSLFVGLVIGACIGSLIPAVLPKFLELSLGSIQPPYIVLFFSILFGVLSIFMIKWIIKIAAFISGFMIGVLFYNALIGLGSDALQNSGFVPAIEQFSLWAIVSGIILGFVFSMKKVRDLFFYLFSSAIGAYIITANLGGDPRIYLIMLILVALMQLWMSKNPKSQQRMTGGSPPPAKAA